METHKLSNVEGILAVDLDNGLAKNGTIPWKSKTDMVFFKRKTWNNVIIMGSNTLISLPNSKPLPNRLNIVVTNNKEKYNNLYDNLVAYNLEEVVNMIMSDILTKFFIIGGNQIYSLLLPYCSTIWLTTIKTHHMCDIILEYDLLSYNYTDVYEDNELTITQLS
jgi:dihydrofolate reductase